MTELLERAIAAMILEELEDDQRWDEAFSRSPDILAKHMIGDKYQGTSHKLLTILMPKIQCQARFLSPQPFHFQAF